MIKTVVDKFYFIQRGWLNANHFVFNGQNKILIDTGYKKELNETLSLIKQTGVEPSNVDLIISTHCHCDHIGGNRYIQQLSGCEIATHYIDRYFIENQNDWYTWRRYYDQEADFFTVHRSVDHGDILMLDELELIVIHTPGHASGMICLYCPQHKFLISSDAVWGDGDFGVITPRIEGIMAPFSQYKSLEKLAALKIKTIYPGHGNVINNPAEAIQKCKQRLEYFLEDPERMGRDQIKKIILYTLLMKAGFREADFFDYLMNTYWYPETANLYFAGQYKDIYNSIIKELINKKMVYKGQGKLIASLQA
ncbi:MAG: hypothetical protein VR67_15700 [Peptococcaceae bacterium BRH_c8a]|nr:MAG: hypothetical protein VR67_15700 [Peptococcaceae bacterium BRH_c8a]